MKLYLFIFLYATSFIYSQNKELKLVSTEIECGDLISSYDRVSERIIKKENIKDTLFLEIQYKENCGNRRIINQNTIKDTIYINFDLDDPIPASCNCIFFGKLKFINNKVENPIIKLKNFEGSRELKQSDSYYLPAEYIIREKDTLVIFDDQGYYYMRSYYDSGNIKSLRIRRNSYSETTLYYENGKIKSTRQILPNFDDYILKEWDENGKLIKFESTIEIGKQNPTQEQKDEGAITIISKDKNIKK